MQSVQNAANVKDLIPSVLMLEDAIHKEQKVEDKKIISWLTSGHPDCGVMVRRFFWTKEEKWDVIDATVEAVLPADGDDPPMWHIKHSNGDEEDLWEDELTKAKGYYENDVKELQGDEAEEAISGWKKTGHAFIGKDVIRFHLTKEFAKHIKQLFQNISQQNQQMHQIII